MLQPPRYETGTPLVLTCVLSFVPPFPPFWQVGIGSLSVTGSFAAPGVVNSTTFIASFTIPNSATYTMSDVAGGHPFYCITWQDPFSSVIYKREEFQSIKSTGW